MTKAQAKLNYFPPGKVCHRVLHEVLTHKKIRFGARKKCGGTPSLGNPHTKVLKISWKGEKIYQKLLSYVPLVSMGWLSGGSSLHRPRSKEPIRR